MAHTFALSHLSHLKPKWASEHCGLVGYARGRIFCLSWTEVKSDATDRAGLSYGLRIYTTRTMNMMEHYFWSVSEKDVTDEEIHGFIEYHQVVNYTPDMLRGLAARELVTHYHQGQMILFREDWYNYLFTREVLRRI